jgi:hypothetical protein
MCHKSYRKYGLNDVDSWDQWVKMVNDNEKYCSNWNVLKEVEFYIYSKLGLLKLYELPSCHIHWGREIKKDKILYVKRIEEKLEKCKEDPSLFKIEFSANTAPEYIRKEILEVKLKYDIK